LNPAHLSVFVGFSRREQRIGDVHDRFLLI
jgi:hypothetical protein